MLPAVRNPTSLDRLQLPTAASRLPQAIIEQKQVAFVVLYFKGRAAEGAGRYCKVPCVVIHFHSTVANLHRGHVRRQRAVGPDLQTLAAG